MGGILIKQALINAHNNPKYTRIKDATRGLAFFATPHHGGAWALVGLGGVVTKIATAMGFQKGDDVLETLKNGNIFSDIMQEHWRHQLLKYDIISFWGARDNIVPAESARLGLPGDHENVVKLNAGHSGICKFGPDLEDQDNFKLVRSNIKDMYRNALKISELNAMPSIVSIAGKAVDDEELHARWDVLQGINSSQLYVYTANVQIFTNPPSLGPIIHGNVHWIGLRALNDLFTGRTELLLRMQKTLRYDVTSVSKQKRLVITGLGGQGKSKVCLKFANLMREEFWGIFWVDVASPLTTKTGFIVVADAFGRSIESVPEALQILANTKKSWLLILYNADDPTFDYQKYIPSGTEGTVIITSRVTECRQYSPENAEELEGLEDRDSKELLLKATNVPRESWLSYDSEADDIVRLLGSHTLALIQAGAYVRQNHCQLNLYPDIYRRHRKRLSKYRPKQALSRYCDVYTTFEASAELLMNSPSEDAKDAMDLLQLLSMLDASILPLHIILCAWEGCKDVLKTSHLDLGKMEDMSPSHCLRLPSFMEVESSEWDPYRLIEASSLLASLSLVTRHELGNSIGLSMHPMTHAWAKDRQRPEQQGVAWITTGCVLTTSQCNTVLWQTQERRLLPHVLSYVHMAVGKMFSIGSKVTVSIIPILMGCGWRLSTMRQDSRLGQLLEDIFKELGKDPQKPSSDALPLYDLQARSLYNLGKAKEAVNLLRYVVEIKEAKLAEDHPDRLASQHELAGAYQANGQVQEAVDLLRHVVEIHESKLAEDHPARLASQHALAGAYQANGQVEEAIDLLCHMLYIN